MFDNSDECDFNLSSSSKLSQLFQDRFVVEDDANTSLKYNPPKQPVVKKDPDNAQSNKTKPLSSVIVAKVVMIWKLEDKEYLSLGKHGLVIIGSPNLNMYELIAYKEKNNIILRSSINSKFTFYNQKNDFSSFYDVENVNWLVKFGKEKEQDEFSEKIKSFGAKLVSTEQQNNGIKSENSENQILNWAPKNQNILIEKDDSSDSSVSNKRSNILSRMAKMGEQIFPEKKLNQSTDMSDSELEEIKTDRKMLLRKFKRVVPVESELTVPIPQPLPRNLDTRLLPTPNASTNPVISQNMSPMMFPVLPYSNISPYYHDSQMSNDFRINLSEINSKLDMLLSNKSPKNNCDVANSKIKTLELRCENLLTEVGEYKKKNYNLQLVCQTFKKQSKEFQQKEMKNVILDLNTKVSELAEEKQNLTNEYQKCQQKIAELKKTTEAQKKLLYSMSEFKRKNESLENLVSTLEDTITHQRMELKGFKDALKKDKDIPKQTNNLTSPSNEEVETLVKKCMNDMYQKLQECISKNRSFDSEEVYLKLAENVKFATFKIIQEYEKMSMFSID